MKMTVLVIDGQGGRLGKLLCESITEKLPETELIAVGTNTTATAAMIKGGAKKAATGENSICVMSKKADVIVGPVGIVIADALMGEITPSAAVAVGQSDAVKILIPSDRCGNTVVGIRAVGLAEMADEAVEKISELAADFGG